MNWEGWPFGVLYAPLAPVWLKYITKSGYVWFFTPSNPKITFGGFEGEGKKEMYDLLPDNYYPSTIYVKPGEDIETVYTRIKQAGLSLPFVVKPEVGMQGLLFRKLDTEEQFEAYHNAMRWEYLVQQFVAYEMEVSVFYVRHPEWETGKITGFLHKIPMQVTGDGVATLEQLIEAHPKAGTRKEEMFLKLVDKLKTIPLKGEKYMLSYAGNHNRGASFVDLKAHIDERLVKIFDEISFKVDDFFYGRYDIMCHSVEDLKKGENFTILEYNGCGAEPNHFYDTGYSLKDAYDEILKHWKYLYEISRYNRKKGIKPWPFKKGKQFLAQARNLWKEMRELDSSI